MSTLTHIIDVLNLLRVSQTRLQRSLCTLQIWRIPVHVRLRLKRYSLSEIQCRHCSEDLMLTPNAMLLVLEIGYIIYDLEHAKDPLGNLQRC